MLLKRPLANTPEARADKYDILELIRFERYCRDNALWDEMRKCFSPDSFVNISWYQGSGDGFVTASSKSPDYAPHRVYGGLTWLNGDRAVTILPVSIQTRKVIRGVLCEMTADTRLVFRTERIEGQWYIAGFEGVYDKDSLTPVLPDATLSLGKEMLGKYRESYACLCYMLEMAGLTVHDDLPGRDRPETEAALWAKLDRWLDGGDYTEG